MMVEQSATTTVLIAEALAHGDIGLAFALLAPGAVATALGLWGDADQQSTYLPAFTGEDVPPAALALLEPRPLFDPFAAADHGAPRRRRLGALRRQVARAERRRGASCSSSPPTPRASARRCSSSSPRPTGLFTEPEPAMGLRAAATGRLRARGRARAGRRAARRGRRRGVRRVRPARPHRLVRARGRHRAGGARLRDPVRQRARRVRRADLQPPGGRLRGLRHRHRARGHAPGDLPRGQPRRPGHAASPARPRSPAGCARTRACRSAPTACSCSAATATSRSTRSSAGTATCERPASMEGALLV